MTIALASHENVRNVAYQTAEAGFTVSEDGNYYLGIHNYSDAYQWQLYVDNVGISIIDAGVPAPVADLKVLAGERGAMSASISFTVPSKTAKGNPLEGTVNATILRDGSLVAMRPNLTPGQKVEFTDNAVAKNGKAIYTVSCSNNAGSSVPVTAEIFVGKDVPGPVRNLVISERDGHPYLSWDAPETGANGGCLLHSGRTSCWCIHVAGTISARTAAVQARVLSVLIYSGNMKSCFRSRKSCVL